MQGSGRQRGVQVWVKGSSGLQTPTWRMVRHLEAFETLRPEECRQGWKRYRPSPGPPALVDLRRENQPRRLRCREGKLGRLVPDKYHISQGRWDAVFPDKEVVSCVSRRSKMKEAKTSGCETYIILYGCEKYIILNYTNFKWCLCCNIKILFNSEHFCFSYTRLFKCTCCCIPNRLFTWFR